MASSKEPFRFLSLPLELRDAIYSLYFKPADRLFQNPSLQALGFYGGLYSFQFHLCQANKQIYNESRRVWKRENVFVKIATPWPSAGGKLDHVSSEGLVPIVCTDERADAFQLHHALVQITAPFHQAVPEHTIVMLLDDLHLFTQTWYYSALSYTMLNQRLSTTFTLRNPDQGDNRKYLEAQNISLALQKRLLLPFGQVKGLYHWEASGFASSVCTELERLMAVPISTLQQCCEESADFMRQGEVALASNNAAEALELFRRAFQSIHILIHGRTRRVLAESFFNEGIEHGPFAGQTGITVRVILRLKLASRSVAAYLQLEQWGEAAFWGMRSIRVMRDTMDTEFEDFLSEFLSGADVGLIYIRTGIAFMKMEEERRQWAGELTEYERETFANSESLWDLAVRYLRNQTKDGVRKEMTDFGVPQDKIRLFADVENPIDTQSMAAHHGSDEEDLVLLVPDWQGHHLDLN